MNNSIVKIKSQKRAAIILTAGAFAVLIHRLFREDFEKHATLNYIICGALLFIIGIGITSFIRSSRKLKNQS